MYYQKTMDLMDKWRAEAKGIIASGTWKADDLQALLDEDSKIRNLPKESYDEGTSRWVEVLNT